MFKVSVVGWNGYFCSSNHVRHVWLVVTDHVFRPVSACHLEVFWILPQHNRAMPTAIQKNLLQLTLIFPSLLTKPWATSFSGPFFLKSCPKEFLMLSVFLRNGFISLSCHLQNACMFSLLFPLPHLTPLLIPSLLLFAYRTVWSTAVCHLGSIRGLPGSEFVLKNQRATQYWKYKTLQMHEEQLHLAVSWCLEAWGVITLMLVEWQVTHCHYAS